MSDNVVPFRASRGSALATAQQNVPPIPDDAKCDFVEYVPNVNPEEQKRCGAPATDWSGLGGASRFLCKRHLKLCRPSNNPFNKKEGTAR